MDKLIGISEISLNHLLLAIAATFFVALQFFSEPLRWLVYCGSKKTDTFKRLFHTFSFAALASYMLPFKLGVPLRIYFLKRMAGMSLGFISRYMIIDAGIYYSCWLFSALLAILLGVNVTLSGLMTKGSVLIIISSVASILIFFFVKKTYRRQYHEDDNIAQQSRIHQLIESLASVTKYKIGMSCIISIIDITNMTIRHYFILMFLGIDQSFAMIASITCISFFIGLVSLMPMGLIGYDATIVILLQNSGIALENALFVPIINRSISVLVISFLGIWSGASMGYRSINSIKALIRVNRKS